VDACDIAFQAGDDAGIPLTARTSNAQGPGFAPRAEAAIIADENENGVHAESDPA